MKCQNLEWPFAQNSGFCFFERSFQKQSQVLLQAVSEYTRTAAVMMQMEVPPSSLNMGWSAAVLPVLGSVRMLGPPGGFCPCCEHLLLNWAERGVLLNGKGLFAPQIDIASAAMTSHRKWKALPAHGRHSKCKCVHLGWTTCGYITRLVCF